MFYVYLLKSIKDGRYYIGHTDDVEKRLGLHNAGKVISTKPRRPFELIGYETYGTRNDARWREYNIKNHSDKKKKFIENLTKRV